uniref:Cystathionine gamma-synthase n=1 Tax=Arundo donax TaxID=35708 RepID=A0A0A9ANG6_ARUDO
MDLMIILEVVTLLVMFSRASWLSLRRQIKHSVSPAGWQH